MASSSKRGRHGKRPQGPAGKLSPAAKVVIVIFAVLMALAMMLPSLASVIASNNQAASQQEAQESSSSDDGGSDSSGTDDSSSSQDDSDDASLDGVPDDLQSAAQSYAGTVAKLEAKLDDDPNNLATLINLANDYMNWGYSSLQSSSTDEDTSYSNGLLQKAIDYFDRYLELNDSNTAKVDRALCQYYRGDTSTATAALEQITQDAPDFGPGWANLGMVYEQAGDTDKAIEAYQKAVDADANNEYGAKSFANQRLVALNKSSSSSSSSTSSDTLGDGMSSSSGASALADTLQNNSGLNL